MGNREAMLELIGRAYAARGRGDLDELMTAFHPEAVFTLAGDKKTLEVAGSVQGHRGRQDPQRRSFPTITLCGALL